MKWEKIATGLLELIYAWLPPIMPFIPLKMAYPLCTAEHIKAENQLEYSIIVELSALLTS